MKLAIAAVPLTVLFGIAIGSVGPVRAAEGDLWAIDRQNVNVRAGPSTSTEILMTINPGERIVEIAAKGEWFFVEFPNYNKRGWVFGPFWSRRTTPRRRQQLRLPHRHRSRPWSPRHLLQSRRSRRRPRQRPPTSSRQPSPKR